MKVYRFKNNKIDFLKHRRNTRELFYYEGDLSVFTVEEEKTFIELVKLVQDGKIAVFPIYEKQETDNIKGHIEYGFTVYFMSYRQFIEFRNKYISECIELTIDSWKEEERQPELPF